MNIWEIFNETSLPDKEAFYSSLNMEDITDVDHRHAYNVFKSINNKILGDYHDLYVQGDTSLLPHVFENFRNMCIELYQLDPAHFFSAPGLAWQACLKKTDVKLELLTDPDMLLMVEKGFRGGICHAILTYAKVNNKYMKNYYKEEEESFLQYDDANNLYEFAMIQPLPVNGFDRMEDLSKIDEDFIKNYNEDSDKGMLNILKIYMICIVIYHFYQKIMKVNKCNKLACNLYDKKKLFCSHKIIKTSIKSWTNIKEIS